MVREQDDTAYESRDLGALLHIDEIACQHGDQYADSNCPRLGRQYGTERGAARGSYHGGGQAPQRELAGLGRLKIGDDHRGDERIDRKFEVEELRQRERQSGSNRRPDG